ncbi:hypothetical protein LDENG_00128690 [Lucifuga dentata]|nr:hypothetical protein LDENG_00128690 [Lucifuga dentata]
MENNHDDPSDKGVLVPVSESSNFFHSNILAPLQSAYLYEESKQCFTYKSAILIKNPVLEEKYNSFRAKRKEVGYSEEELKECYGFLLFDDADKVNTLGETGVLTGNSTCTTLGDPSKGVYISMYSDCLDLNHWYHGKSGYVAIIRLTKGKVKEVLENYTQNFTAPSVGFDCHVSIQLSSVSSNTSSFLAFERTQYYLYELLDNGSNETTQSPTLACPFAFVSFSYMDAKTTHIPIEPHKKSEGKAMACHYLPWHGQLQIGSHFYNIGLRTTTGALIPAKLPAVVKADRAISMLDLRQLLPKQIFETCFTGEVSLDETYCSVCELVSSVVEEASSLSLLIQELKEKDLALTCQLNDGGFLVLLHLSHLLTYNDTGSSAAEVLHGIFVFPNSRVIKTGTKIGQRFPTISSEILRILPALNYAEGEMEKTLPQPSEEQREVLVQHMQSYAGLINPGLAASPPREVCIFPDQYDLPDAPIHLSSAPKWTNRAWQGFRSYLSQPVSFQLPVSRTKEILEVGFENRREELDLEVFICLSSPEEVPGSPASIKSEDQLGCLESTVPVKTVLENHIPGPEAQVDSTTISQNEVPNVLQAGDNTRDTEIPDLTVLNKNDIGEKTVPISTASDDLPTELIVSIASAEKTAGVTDNNLSMIGAVSETKHNEIQLSGLLTAKLHMADMYSVNDETDKEKKPLYSSVVSDLTAAQQTVINKRPSCGYKKASKSCAQTNNLQALPAEDDESMNEKRDQDVQTSDHLELSEPSNSVLRKLPKRLCKFGKLPSKNQKVKSGDVNLLAKQPETRKQTMEGNLLMELEAALRRKMDLKPIITKCRRILVPHGSREYADQNKYLKDKWESAKVERCNAKMLVDAPVKAHDTEEMESSTALETVSENTETTRSVYGGNLQNVVVGHAESEPSHSKQSDGGNGEKMKSNDHSSENVAMEDLTPIQIDSVTCSSEVVQEKYTDRFQPVKRIKSEVLLRKLRSALSRGKRKADHLISEEVCAQVTESCLKKSKGDSDSEMLKRNYLVKTVLGINEGAEEVSKIPPVDLHFAHALGLTPKKISDKVQNTEGQDPQLRRNLSEVQEQVVLEKQPQPQIIQRHPSILLGKSRVKTLRKHQDIPAEYIKKKWWLHFQTPASFANENHTYKESCRDSSVRNNLTDALTLLADLALGASNKPSPQQPDTTLERKPDSCLESCNLTKDVTNVEQESVLHTLLRQPAARPVLLLESPSPNHPVGSNTVDVVGLIYKEHTYSLPPSASPGLSGRPFQVSPLSGSTGLDQHDQKIHGNVIQTQSSIASQGDRRGHDHRTSEYLKKHMVHRRKIRCSRYVVNKNGSVHVTRMWKENYDFNLDSKFTNDTKDKTVIRALHGPWDLTIQESIEELQLIVHVWIGLFYSRSTPRLFHIGNNCAYPYLEESDDLEMTSVMTPALAESELKSSAAASSPAATSDTSVSKALDLSKTDTSGLNKGSVILDLSLRNHKEQLITSGRHVDKKEISVSHETEAMETLDLLKPSVGLHEGSTTHLHQTQSQAFQHIISEVDDNDDRSICENTTTGPSLKADCQECVDPMSSKSDRIYISCAKMANVCFQTESIQTSLKSCHILHGFENETTGMKDSFEDFGNTKVQKLGTDSSQTMAGKGVNSNELDDVVHTNEHDDNELHDGNESKDGEHKNLKERSYQEGNIESSLTAVHTSDDSSKESSASFNVNLLQNEEQLTREDSKALSSCQTENVYEDEDHHAVHKGKVIRDEVHSGKEDGPDMKDSFVSVVLKNKQNFLAGSDLNDQPVAMMCDTPASGREDYITKCNDQASLDKQPPPTESEKVACSDSVLRKQCKNGSALTDKSAISVKTTCTAFEMPLCMEPGESVEEAKLENNDICSPDKVHCLKSALHKTDNTHSSGGSFEALPKIKGDIEQENSNSVQSDDCKDQVIKSEDWVTKSFEGKRKVDNYNTTQKALLHYHQGEVVKNDKGQLGLTKKEVVEKDSINEGLGDEIPFIGVAVSRQETLHLQMSLPQVKAEEVLQGQEEIQNNISETTYHERILPTVMHSISQVNSEKVPLSAGKGSIFDLSETSHPLVCKESESDNRCPMPIMDEKPYDHLPFSDPCHRTYFSSGNEVSKNIFQKDLSRNSISIQDELPFEQKPCLKPTAKTDSNPYCGLSYGNQVTPDLELRTQRVLRIVDQYLSKSIAMDKSRQCETADIQLPHDQAPNPNSTTIATNLASSYTTANSKEMKTNKMILDNKVNEATEPHCSMVCTVFNSGTKRSYSLLESVSQRCMKNDLTLASVEQEYLIFSEKMKQLLKRSRREAIHYQDKSKLSCSSPLTVHFSTLEEQEDSVDHFEGLPPLVGHKIKVDLSERRGLADTANEERILNSQKLSYGTDKGSEHTGVSGVTAEYAMQYEAMMNDVCAGKKLSSRTKDSQMERGYCKTEPSNHFDFHGVMTREMYGQFHSSLNLVEKQSCKTKFRFFILATSDDIIFEQTKALLEAEGHNAVQPSQFFHGENSSSYLLVILRNEDIAEHICEVPHLLELKRSPGVLFAGIDEPGDIVNLNYQALFMRGGFIMFDRAALEPLSLCKMKRISGIVENLNTLGKWKWMLHYRDSRWLKETARLNAEAMEKQNFLTSCQEAGIVEVLPYHECDLASRDRPNYLTCLVKVQIQNISARYSVFVTDMTTDATFGRNGILTMTVSSFMTAFPNEMFPV